MKDLFKKVAISLLAATQLFLVAPHKSFAFGERTTASTVNGLPQTNELYDFSDPTTKLLYEQIKKTEGPGVISRDTSSWDEITDFVKSNAEKFDGDGVIIISGAYPHIIGALVNLAKSGKFNLQYIPVKNLQISTQTADVLSDKGAVATEDLRKQMERDIGTAKFLGFDDMEAVQAFLKGKETKQGLPTLRVIVENETGLHHLYNGADFSKKIEEFLTQEVNEVKDNPNKPKWIGLIGEDLCAAGLEKSLRSGGTQEIPVFKATQEFMKLGLQLSVGAFGWKGNQQQQNNQRFLLQQHPLLLLPPLWIR